MKTLLSIICSKKVKYSLLFIILFNLYFFICAFTYVNAISNDITNSVFRLHIIANSDSEEDQNLKLKVRDNLLKYMNELCINTASKEEAIKIANSHFDDFILIAKDTIKENGFNYNVSAEIGDFYFPKKDYADISLPEGIYNALKIEIGNASGHNWWCVMFPPLCFVNVSTGIVPDNSKELIKNELTTDEYNIITNSENPDIKFKIKILEWFKNNDILTAKK